MSKIFEALQRARGNPDDALPPGLEDPAPTFEESPLQSSNGAPKAKDEPQESDIRTVPIRVPKGLPVLPFDTAHNSAAEQYRMIRTRIVQSLVPRQLLLVSSPDSGDGKTISTINIAGALALKADANVLILDADLCRPAIAKTLGIPTSPGLAEVLAGDTPLQDAVVRVEQFRNLYVLPAGELTVNRTELLDSPRWKAVCDAVRSQFRFTILDAPPIDAVADYPLIQSVCDGVIVIVRPDHTNRVRCAHALKTVPKEKLIGVVINAAKSFFFLRHSPYHYYGYSYYNTYADSKPASNGHKP
jgi:capsular exopolysaccharide synthesis family protein